LPHFSYYYYHYSAERRVPVLKYGHLNNIHWSKIVTVSVNRNIGAHHQLIVIRLPALLKVYHLCQVLAAGDVIEMRMIKHGLHKVASDQ